MKFYKEYNRFVSRLFNVLYYAVGVLLMGLLVFSLINVAARLIGVPISWLDELQRYIMIWMAFISGAVLVNNKGHLLVDCVDLFPRKWRNVMYLVGEILCLAFIIYLIFPCIEIVQKNMISKSSALRISMGFVYLCMPISCVLSVLAQVNLILGRLFGEKAAENGTEPAAVEQVE